MEERIHSDRHLHLRLLKVAKSVYGIDAAGHEVQLLRDKHSVPNLFEANCEDLEHLPLEASFDVIVAPELLEHLNNPGRCLTGVKRFMHRDSFLVISTPNSLSLKAFAWGLARRDNTSPHHSLQFSFGSLANLLQRHNLQPCQWWTALSEADSIRAYLATPLLRGLFYAFPQFGDTLVVASKLSPGSSV